MKLAIAPSSFMSHGGPTITRTHRGWSWNGLRGAAGATFSACEKYRYVLWRDWRGDGADAPPMVFLGLNPSTADERAEDPTIRRIISFAARLGCGGLVMLNIFALRSTDPARLRDVVDPVGPDNDAAIADWSRRGAPVVVGWGTHGDLLGRGDAVARALLAAGIEPRCFGLTKGGHPRHPLYIRADAPLVAWSPSHRAAEARTG